MKSLKISGCNYGNKIESNISFLASLRPPTSSHSTLEIEASLLI
jgi:hypothetical protein